MTHFNLAIFLVISLASGIYCGHHHQPLYGYDNIFDGPVNFQCPPGQVLFAIRSRHDNHREDRLFKHYCRPCDTSLYTSDTFKTNFQNYFDEAFLFRCPFGSVITGTHSIHDNRREDRRYSFTCTRLNYAKDTFDHCFWTAYTQWDQTWYIAGPVGYYMTATQSFHNNHREDRRFRFEFCKLHHY